jgi:hypothetical protein
MARVPTSCHAQRDARRLPSQRARGGKRRGHALAGGSTTALSLSHNACSRAGLYDTLITPTLRNPRHWLFFYDGTRVTRRLTCLSFQRSPSTVTDPRWMKVPHQGIFCLADGYISPPDASITPSAHRCHGPATPGHPRADSPLAGSFAPCGSFGGRNTCDGTGFALERGILRNAPDDKTRALRYSARKGKR